ncbi:MAG: class I SAM-dependent methyltransferase [Candidatus Omnitrophica bacterium]|nr:class I SAM-dependent methyltransferase [Candidatus Omnitrophota bacterium]
MNSASSVLHLNENCVIKFPAAADSLDQDEEWCIVVQNGKEKRIRFHDYDEVYKVPKLYEHLFYEKLKCNSPRIICGLLQNELDAARQSPEALNVLEIGAGNGMVGEQLKRMGVSSIVGLDIIPEAKAALRRDRPNIYDDYFVADLTQLPPQTEEKLELEPFNCLVTVAALGFGDIPPAAFSKAYNLISSPGWLAFNIKERFLTEKDPTGFCLLIREMKEQGIIQLKTVERFRHRYALGGAPLYYNGVIAKKVDEIPKELLEKVENAPS